MFTTAVAPSDRLVAVRLPSATGFALSDRLLVVAPPGATSLMAGDGRRAPLTGGAGVLTAPVPAALDLTAVDAAGPWPR